MSSPTDIPSATTPHSIIISPSTTTSPTTTTPLSGKGTSLQSPAWSSGIINNPSASPQYITDDIVSSPRFVRVTLDEARAMQGVGKTVYNATTLQPVAEGEVPPMATGAWGLYGQPFESQEDEIWQLVQRQQGSKLRNALYPWKD